MKRPPYIGITDVTTRQEADAMVTVFNEHTSPTQTRLLHIGVMMSYKTLRGLPTSWTGVFPQNSDIASIFTVQGTMNCLHYADYAATDVETSLKEAIVWGGPGMTALQLDMVWPDPYAVEKALNTADRHTDLVLQVGKNALLAVADNPSAMVKKLREYFHFDYVLLDKSMGKGIGMDAVGLLPFARAIRDAFPHAGIVAAGGLGPSTMHLIDPLVAEFPDISIDAQGRLRQSGDAHDPIDWNMAAEYLRAALTVLP
jgi:hypothetical protein